MSEMIKDIEGVKVVVDALLFWGSNKEEHDSRLEKVLQHTHSRNLKLNKKKIKQNKITCISHILSEEGVNLIPKKVQVIKAIKIHEQPKKQRGATKMFRYDDLPLKVHSQLL